MCDDAGIWGEGVCDNKHPQISLSFVDVKVIFDKNHFQRNNLKDKKVTLPKAVKRCLKTIFVGLPIINRADKNS